MADRLTFFRLMVKQVAKEAGLVATFMPKPYTSAWGSGHHFNMSVEDTTTGVNLFRDADDARGKGWSKTAYAFVAGIIAHARAIAAVATPTVNSYKRLPPPGRRDGVVGAVHRVRRQQPLVHAAPAPHRPPSRTGGRPAANTYLTAAIMLAAGLEEWPSVDPGDPVGRRLRLAQRGPAPSACPTTCKKRSTPSPTTRSCEICSRPTLCRPRRHEAGRVGRHHRQVTDWERDKYLLAF
jgi:glutamine synthetase